MPDSVSMKKSFHSNQQRVHLEGCLAEFRQALEDEIKEIEQSGHSTIILKNGEKISSSEQDQWYRFFVDYLPAMPADTPCKLIIGNDSYDVTVIGCDDDYITVKSVFPLPDTLGYAKLENGSTVLMELLIKRIEINAEKANRAGTGMLQEQSDTTPAFNRIHYFTEDQLALDHGNNKAQRNAILQSLSNDITFIWGPPGTGKTTVIGQIIYNLLKQEHSVLVVSHTNTAVDGAIKKTAEILNKHKEYKFSLYPLLRIGTPGNGVPEQAKVDYHIHELGHDIETQLADLKSKEKVLTSQIKQIQIVCKKKIWLMENKIDEIVSIKNIILSLNESCNHLKKEVSALQMRYQDLCDQHPAFREYEEITKKYQVLEQDYKTLIQKKESVENLISQIVKEICICQDELAKHQKKEALRVKIENSISKDSLEKQIQEQQKDLNALQEQLTSLRAEQTTLSASIVKLKQRNALTKLFSKKAIAQQEARVREIDTEMVALALPIEIKRHALEITKEEFLALQVQFERMNAIHVSWSVPYWSSKLSNTKAMLEHREKELSRIQEQVQGLMSKLISCREQYFVVHSAFTVVEDARVDLITTQKSLQNYNDELQEKQKYLAQLVEEERINCSAFGEALNDVNPLDSLIRIRAELLNKYETSDLTEDHKKEEKLQEEYAGVNEAISVLEQQRAGLEQQVILSTPVIGATLAKSYLSDVLQSRVFDTVILDEASMASIPALWCASQLAEKNLIIVGDFLQLSPIVIAKNSPAAKKWLGTDIFNLNGIQERARKGNKAPDNIVILDQQYRMEKEIAEIANLYYGDYHRLNSNDDTQERNEQRSAFYNWYNGKKQNHCVHLIDTKNLGAWVTGVPQGSSHSRYNCFSAAIDVELAFKLIEKKLGTQQTTEDPLVLIVVPYKPQVVMIERYIEAYCQARGIDSKQKWVQAGTIHRFQGSEADIVIFDLVVDEPHWKANLFMADEEVNKGLEQMFNVAVTRAKFKLFLVGNFSFCMKRAKNNALGRLLDYLINEQQLERLDAKSLFPRITYAPPHAYVEDGVLTHGLLTCKGEYFDSYLLADIQNAKKQIVFFSPFITENRLSKLLPYFRDAINRGIHINVITKAQSDRKENEKSTYLKYINALKDCGANIIYKKNMHEKLIFIDEDVIWNGSLNPLSFTGITGEIMNRIKNKEFFDFNVKCMDLEQMLSRTDHPQEGFCPICDGKLIMCDASNGGFYWTCENKDYTWNPSQPYPYDDVLRCRKCNGEFRFEMRKQPRWVCQANPKHYQNVRKNDLKLPRMLALIPPTDQSRVQEYFFRGQQMQMNMFDSES